MKLKKALPLITTSLLFISNPGFAAPEVGSLTITMQGIEADAGQAIFILMDSKSSHVGDTAIYARQVSVIDQQSARVTFADIPNGDYSAVIYHDINANGELDRGLFGKPTEPYGFSNNARGSFGIPEFEDSSFEVGVRHSYQTITVK